MHTPTLQTITWGDPQHQRFDQIFEIAAKSGFSALEIGYRRLGQATSGAVSALPLVRIPGAALSLLEHRQITLGTSFPVFSRIACQSMDPARFGIRRLLRVCARNAPMGRTGIGFDYRGTRKNRTLLGSDFSEPAREFSSKARSASKSVRRECESPKPSSAISQRRELPSERIQLARR